MAVRIGLLGSGFVSNFYMLGLEKGISAVAANLLEEFLRIRQVQVGIPRVGIDFHR